MAPTTAVVYYTRLSNCAQKRADELEKTIEKMRKQQDERDATDLMNMFGDMHWQEHTQCWY